jgi:hypothetical protein
VDIGETAVVYPSQTMRPRTVCERGDKLFRRRSERRLAKPRALLWSDPNFRSEHDGHVTDKNNVCYVRF